MRRRRSHCVRCRRPDTVAGRMSKRGLCLDCAERAQRETIEQLGAKSGPIYEKWVEGWSESPGPHGRPITPY